MASKQRCDGESPCMRCATKELTCSYPSTTRLKDRPAVAINTAVGNYSVPLSTESGGPSAAGETFAVGQVHDAESHVPPSQRQRSPGAQDCVPSAVPASADVSEGSISATFDPAQLDMAGVDRGADADEQQSSPVPDSTWLHQPFDPSIWVDGTAPMECSLTQPQCLQNGVAVNDLSSNDETKPSRTGPIYDLLAPRCSHEIQLELPDDLGTSYKADQDSGDAGAWMFEDYGHIPRLPSEAYQAIVNWFEKVNCDGDLFQRFTDMPLPSLDVLNSFMQVYFEEFHPLFPFLHVPSLVPSEENWILVLAAATIGSRFSQALACTDISKSLDELLRRAVVIAVRPTLPGPSMEERHRLTST